MLFSHRRPRTLKHIVQAVRAAIGAESVFRMLPEPLERFKIRNRLVQNDKTGSIYAYRYLSVEKLSRPVRHDRV